MRKYVVFTFLVIQCVYSAFIQHDKIRDDEKHIKYDSDTINRAGLEVGGGDVDHSRVRRSDDYDDDEGGFVVSSNKDPDHDFIVNVQSCADGFVRAPWGACISCAQYKKKLRSTGPGC